MAGSQNSSARIRNRAERIEVSDLRSDAYEVVEFYKNHQMVDDALAIDLSSTIALAKALPVGLRGSEHRKMRADLAKILARGKQRLTLELPGVIHRHFAVLDEPGTHDFLDQVCRPFADDCIGILSGLPLDPEITKNLSDVFDPGAGIARRRRLESDIRTFLESVRGHCPVDVDDDGVTSLAVAVMGRDPLLGSLAFSLHRHFSACVGTAISSQVFPAVPSDTGVPYVWRVSKSPDQGTYECRFDHLSKEGPKDRLKFFGLGRHTCLGKNHTLQIFEALSNHLSKCQRRIVSSTISTDARHVLRIPKEFVVEVK